MSTLNVTNISDGTNSTSTTNVVQGSAKAWVNFNGIGTVAIRAQYNVASITDNGSGNYTVNFTTALTDADYCVNTTCSADGNGDNRSTGTDRTANTASSVRVYSFQTVTQSGTDDDVFCVAVHR